MGNQHQALLEAMVYVHSIENTYNTVQFKIV